MQGRSRLTGGLGVSLAEFGQRTRRPVESFGVVPAPAGLRLGLCALLLGFTLPLFTLAGPGSPRRLLNHRRLRHRCDRQHGDNRNERISICHFTHIVVLLTSGDTMTLTNEQRNLLTWAAVGALVILAVGVTVLATAGEKPAKDERDIPVMPISAPVDPAVAAREALEACDRLAAHPEDPNRLSAGVPETGMAVGIAVQTCAQARALNPESLPTRFNYGRALYAAQRDPEAMVEWIAAAEAGYLPALTLVGDALVAGRAVPGESADFASALHYYEQAAALGHQPALARIDETREIIARNTFVETHFQNPGFMRRLYDGRIADVEYPISLLAYMRGVVQALDSTEAIYLDQSCKPMISKLGSTVVEFGQVAAYLGQAGRALSAGNGSDFWTEAARGVGQHFLSEFSFDQGYRDGIVLFDEDVYGCDSSVTEEIIRHIMITARRS